MDEEVSVADLLVREGWGERVPPPSRSRWRMVAVMLAVVVGCGAAAVLVGFGTTANDEATRITEMKVIEMPDRTSGAGGVSETNPPATVEGSGQSDSTAGDDETTAPSSPKITSILDPLNPRGSDTPSSSTQQQAPSTTSGTSTEPTGTSEPGAGGATNTPPPSTTTTRTRPQTCVLIICI